MNLSPKRLSLNEMWKLYLLLKDSLGDSTEELLVDEIKKIISKIDVDEYKNVLQLLYGKRIFSRHRSEYLLYFVAGLKKNNFFSFVFTIKGISK